MKLEHRVTCISGSSRGIGKAIATTFAREGAAVVVNYLQDTQAAESVVQQIEVEGGRAIAVKADVSNKKQADRLIKETYDKFGRLDVLVNNAGIRLEGDILDTSQEDWDRTLAVNLKGPFNCMQAAAKLMVRQGFGKIVNISSVSGLGCAPKGELAYSCAKAGLMNLTMTAALDLGSQKINVNCIAPGFTTTDMTVRGAGDKFGEVSKLKAQMANLERVGEPQDIANAALFLATEESSFITGQVLVVDGGRKDFLSHS